MEGYWKFLGPGGGGGVVLKAKFLEAMYENKLEFPRDGEYKTKNLPWGGMDILWNCSLFSRFDCKVSAQKSSFCENFWSLQGQVNCL